MYRKLIDEHTLEAPPHIYKGNGVVIFNFDRNEALMKQHGYYPVYPDPVIPENQQISSQSTFTFVPLEREEIIESEDSSSSESIMHDDSYISAEWIYEDVPVEAFPERDEAETMMAQRILALVMKYNAMEDFQRMEDITIPGLLALAQQYQVTSEDLHDAETEILILARHLEAITELSWSDTWAGFKSRFPGYMATLLKPSSSDSSSDTE